MNNRIINNIIGFCLRLATIFICLAVAAPVLSDDGLYMRRKGQKVEQPRKPIQKYRKPGRNSGISRANLPHTDKIIPPCALALVKKVKTSDIWLLDTTSGEIPIFGIEMPADKSPEEAKALAWLEKKLSGEWVKICHPKLLGLLEKPYGLVYMEPELMSIQEQMVALGYAKMKKKK